MEVAQGIPETVLGIGGAETIYLHDVTFYIPGGPVRIRAGFQENLTASGLLGMSEFFEQYVVTFEPDEQVCTLQRVHRQ